MRRLSLAFFITVIVGAVGSVLVAHYDELLPTRWQTYTPQDRSFSLELPGTPREVTTQVALEDGGRIILHMVTTQPNDHMAYSCAYGEREDVNGKTADQVLDSARDGSLRKIQGTLLSQKRVTVRGHPGLEFQATACNNSIVDARILLVSSRIYMMMAVATERSVDTKAATTHVRLIKAQLVP